MKRARPPAPRQPWTAGGSSWQFGCWCKVFWWGRSVSHLWQASCPGRVFGLCCGPRPRWVRAYPPYKPLSNEPIEPNPFPDRRPLTSRPMHHARRKHAAHGPQSTLRPARANQPALLPPRCTPRSATFPRLAPDAVPRLPFLPRERGDPWY